MSVPEKFCSRCETTKTVDIENWYFRGDTPVHPCRDCTCEISRLRRAEKADEINAKRREAYHANPEHFRIQKRKSEEGKREERKAWQKAYRDQNKDRLNATIRARRAPDRDAINEANRRWKAANPEKVAEYTKRRLSKIEFRICDNVGKAIRDVLASCGLTKRQRKMEMLGFSAEELLVHLEGLFEHDMSFENYGDWHIDHIRPRSSFTLQDGETEVDFIRRVWDLNNLAPLWAKDNHQKSARKDWVLPEHYRNPRLRELYDRQYGTWAKAA